MSIHDRCIDDLIRDIIVEDKFKAKYTKRQQSVFCKNMYHKIKKFIDSYQNEYDQTIELYQKKQECLERKCKTSNKMTGYLLMFMYGLNIYYISIYYLQSQTVQTCKES